MLTERDQRPNPRLWRLLLSVWVVSGMLVLISPAKLGVVWVLLATFLSFAMLDEHAAKTVRADDGEGS